MIQNIQLLHVGFAKLPSAQTSASNAKVFSSTQLPKRHDFKGNYLSKNKKSVLIGWPEELANLREWISVKLEVSEQIFRYGYENF